MPAFRLRSVGPESVRSGTEGLLQRIGENRARLTRCSGSEVGKCLTDSGRSADSVGGPQQDKGMGTKEARRKLGGQPPVGAVSFCSFRARQRTRSAEDSQKPGGPSSPRHSPALRLDRAQPRKCPCQGRIGIVEWRRIRFFGWIAQLVEQRTENPCVASSILAPATTFNNTNRIRGFVRFCGLRFGPH